MAKIWQLSAQYSGLNANGTINGFPAFTADTAGSGEAGFATAPLNPFLIGKGNVLKVEITAKANDPALKCSVEDAMTGDIIDTGLADEIAIPDGDPPHVIEIKFDSDVSGFEKLLEKARPTDAKAITDFAISMRDTLNSGDTDAALGLFKTKFEAMSAAFGQPMDMMMEQARGMVEAFTSVKHEFGPEDVDPRPCCDNKLWELRHKDGKPLIRIIEEDGHMALDAVVAVLPDGPAIVL
jgi:hypothetical protein